MSKMSYSGCASRGSVAEISCNVAGSFPAMLAAAGEQGYRVAERCPVGSWQRCMLDAWLAGRRSTMYCSGCCRCSSRAVALGTSVLGSVLCHDVWCQVHAASWLGSQAWCSVEWCSARSTRHRGRAVGRSLFLLVVLMRSVLDGSVERMFAAWTALFYPNFFWPACSAIG